MLIKNWIVKLFRWEVPALLLSPWILLLSLSLHQSGRAASHRAQPAVYLCFSCSPSDPSHLWHLLTSLWKWLFCKTEEGSPIPARTSHTLCSSLHVLHQGHCLVLNMPHITSVAFPAVRTLIISLHHPRYNAFLSASQKYNPEIIAVILFSSSVCGYILLCAKIQTSSIRNLRISKGNSEIKGYFRG